MFFISIILFFLFVTAFFAATETSLSFSSRAKLHQWSLQKVKNASLAKFLQDKPRNVISSLLAGNTLINLMIASVAGGWFARRLSVEWQAVASFLLGIFLLIYAEILPKMIAIEHPEKILLKSAKIIYFVSLAFKPFNAVVNMIAKFTLRLIKVTSHTTTQDAMMEEELRGLIDIYAKKYSRKLEEEFMLKSILDLTKVTLDDIMIHRKDVEMLNADETTDNILECIRSSPFTRLPVWKGDRDNIISIVHVKSVLEFLLVKDSSRDSLDFAKLGNKPWFVPNTTNLLEQLNGFKLRQEHFAVIVDEYGLFSGIVTLEDVLEEIVGDISDEFDLKIGKILRASDGSILVSGDCTIRDLNRHLGLKLPEDEAATISGLLLYTARVIPEVGKTYEIGDTTFEIVKKRGHQVVLIKILNVLETEVL